MQGSAQPALSANGESSKDSDGAPSIRIEGLRFEYPGARAPVLHDIGVVVPSAAQFAIIGPSGSGKSTLLAIIMGVLTPTIGRVLVGGKEPKSYFGNGNPRLGYVGAEPFLIAGSLRENLLYGCREPVSEADIEKALSQAQLLQTVTSLPNGLEYQLDENGRGLSAGQQQRVCLARALLGRPQLLILDEASANLDVETELQVADSLQALRGQCTILIVSHRPGMIRHADYVLHLESGGAELRIKDSGERTVAEVPVDRA
ncbi:MAG: ATP-binding cassette domain-containing protein [Polyangiales bacterium]